MTISKEELKKIRTTEGALKYGNYGKSRRHLKPIEKGVFLRLEKSFGSQLKPSIIQKTVELMDIAIDSYHENNPIRKERKEILDSFLNKVNGGDGENEKIYAAFELHREIGNYLYKAGLREKQKNEVDLEENQNNLMHWQEQMKKIIDMKEKFRSGATEIAELSAKNDDNYQSILVDQKNVEKIQLLILLISQENKFQDTLKANLNLVRKNFGSKLISATGKKYETKNYIKEKIFKDIFSYNAFNSIRQICQFIWYADEEKLLKTLKENDFFYYLKLGTYHNIPGEENMSYLEKVENRIKLIKENHWAWRVGMEILFDAVDEEEIKSGNFDLNKILVPRTLTPINFVREKDKGKIFLSIDSPFFLEFSLGQSVIREIISQVPLKSLINQQEYFLLDDEEKEFHKNFFWFEDEYSKKETELNYRIFDYLGEKENFFQNPLESLDYKSSWTDFFNQRMIGFLTGIFPAIDPIMTKLSRIAKIVLTSEEILEELNFLSPDQKLNLLETTNDLNYNFLISSFEAMRITKNDEEVEKNILDFLDKVNSKIWKKLGPFEDRNKEMKSIKKEYEELHESEKLENQRVLKVAKVIYQWDKKKEKLQKELEVVKKKLTNFPEAFFHEKHKEEYEEFKRNVFQKEFVIKIIKSWKKDIEKDKITVKELLSKNEGSDSQKRLEIGYSFFESPLINLPFIGNIGDKEFFLKDSLIELENNCLLLNQQIEIIEKVVKSGAKKFAFISQDSSHKEKNEMANFNEWLKIDRNKKNFSWIKEKEDEKLKKKEKKIEEDILKIEEGFKRYLFADEKCIKSLKDDLKEDLENALSSSQKEQEKYTFLAETNSEILIRLKKKLETKSLRDIFTKNYLSENPLLQPESESVLWDKKKNQSLLKRNFVFCETVEKIKIKENDFEKRPLIGLLGMASFKNFPDEILNSPSINIREKEKLITEDFKKGLINYYNYHAASDNYNKLFRSFSKPQELRSKDAVPTNEEILKNVKGFAGTDAFLDDEVSTRDYAVYTSFLLTSRFCQDFEEVLSIAYEDKSKEERQAKRVMQKFFLDFIIKKNVSEDWIKKVPNLKDKKMELEKALGIEKEKLEKKIKLIKYFEEFNRYLCSFLNHCFFDEKKTLLINHFKSFRNSFETIYNLRKSFPVTLFPLFKEVLIYELKEVFLEKSKKRILEKEAEISQNKSKISHIEERRSQEEVEVSHIEAKKMKAELLIKEYIPKWGNERDTFNLLSEECNVKDEKEEVEEETELSLTLFRFDTPGYRLFWGTISLGIVWGIFKILWKFEEFQEWLDEPIENEDWKE